jgi:glycosyltransferase involved in cell wall biosynthesis
MNILFTSHRFFPDLGGIETHSRILVDFFLKAGHKVVLVTKSLGHMKVDRENFDFPIFRRPNNLLLWNLHCQADVVFQNNIEAQTLWPSFFVKKPVVITIQTWICSASGQMRLRDYFKKMMLRRAACVVAISESVRKSSFPNALVIPNSYDESVFKINQGLCRSRELVFVGRLVSDKGVDLLVNVFSSIARNTLAKLTIVGVGPEEAALRALVISLGIQARVDFVGPLTGAELAEMLGSHEIAVIPSIWEEPFGIVALEAAACGCVVVGSDGGGLPEAIGPCGLLFKRGDPLDLERVLRRLLEDSSLRDSIRVSSVRHLEMHRMDFLSKKYLDLLENLPKQK